MDLVDLEKLIVEICDEYVSRWKTEGKRYINIQNFEQTYLENNLTPIERETTLVTKLRMLNKENPAIPPEIPQLPLDILRKLAICLTKTLVVQVNRDHYEYWAWSAEVFRAFENSSPILKALKDEGTLDLLFLLFHICLAKLGEIPLTHEAEILNKVIDLVVSRHVKHIIDNKFAIGIPIGAATLETVLKTFIKLYGSDEAKENLLELEKKGNATLRKTLDIFEKKVLPYTSQDFQANIRELNKIIESTWNGENWRKILSSWRNNFMHKAETWAPRAFGIYTNYVCLVLWYTIPQEEYTSKSKELLKTIEWRTRLSVAEDYWSFYPPN